MLRDLLPETRGVPTLSITLEGEGREEKKIFSYLPLGFSHRKTWISGQAEVKTVDAQGQARDLGLKKGWVIVAINGEDVTKKRYGDVVKILNEASGSLTASAPQASTSQREVTFATSDKSLRHSSSSQSPRNRGSPPRSPSLRQPSGGGGAVGPAVAAMGRRNVPEAMRSLLVEAGASPEVLQFWTEWDTRLLRQAASSCRQMTVLLSSDTKFIEIQVTGLTSPYLSYLRQFIYDTGSPEQCLKEVSRIQEEVEAQLATLWCRFRHMGGTERKPSVDAGITLHTEAMRWQTADLLMPDIGDEDTLREFAMEDQDTILEPTGFSCSIFPVEPERGLLFDMPEDTRSILPSFLVFKAMGFAKPQDAAVKILSTCLPRRKAFAAYMGPGGLTRIVLRLADLSKFLAYELAEALHSRYHSELIDQTSIWLGIEPNVIEYIADSRGYSAGVGFQF